MDNETAVMSKVMCQQILLLTMYLAELGVAFTSVENGSLLSHRCVSRSRLNLSN